MMDTPVFEVLALGGDGIGPEVPAAGLAVAEAATTGTDIGLTTSAQERMVAEERRGHNAAGEEDAKRYHRVPPAHPPHRR